MGRRQADQPIRVLIVEDSRAQRELLVSLLDSAPGFAVAGTAANGREGVDATVRLRPDIVAMDIHLPVIDGYEATRQIMRRCPTPIVMISSDVGDAARRSIEAQTVGALAVVRKPGGPRHSEYQRDVAALLRTLRLMVDVPLVTRHGTRPLRSRALAGDVPHPRKQPRVLAVASSTGGPAAVQTLLTGLGADFPLPMLLAQHISRGFVEALVTWLNSTTPLTVKLTYVGEYIQPGCVYLPPDDQHIMVAPNDQIVLRPMKESDRYCPSGNHLFSSVATVYGAQAIGVIMTGMGNDGAEGLQMLHATGAQTFAQDEASCVVYGMPQAAVSLGAVTRVEPLAGLARAVLQSIARAKQA